jgi:rubrerythrin
LIESLTAGDIKSLSGLDDIKVLKGRDNFKALREIAKIACPAPEEADAMVKAINDAELHHQTNFVPCLERSGSHKCDCATCGFNCEGE